MESANQPDNQDHFRALERLYASAPINDFLPADVSVEHGKSTIRFEVTPACFHTLGSLHGAVYFKLLDDSAAFAALSLSDEVPAVTVNFTIDYFAPVTEGQIVAIGQVVRIEGKKLFVEATLTDSNGVEVARGSGLFLPAKLTFAEVPDYQR